MVACIAAVSFSFPGEEIEQESEPAAERKSEPAGERKSEPAAERKSEPAGERKSAPGVSKKLERSGEGVSVKGEGVGRKVIGVSVTHLTPYPCSIFFAVAHSFIPFACIFRNPCYAG